MSEALSPEMAIAVTGVEAQKLDACLMAIDVAFRTLDGIFDARDVGTVRRSLMAARTQAKKARAAR